MTTKTLLAIGAAAAAMVLAAGSAAWAATGSDSVGASATVITPVTITAVNTLAFGNVASGAAQGTETVSTAGVASVGGGAVLPTGHSSTAQGTATVAGVTGYTYDLAIPTSSISMTGTGTTGTVSLGSIAVNQNAGSDISFTSGHATLTLASGGDTLNIGGTITISAGAAGSFSGSIPLTVVYN